MFQYLVITLNGKAVAFIGDDMVEIDGTYYFSYEGETVAEFRKEAIAGYCKVEKREEDDY